MSVAYVNVSVVATTIPSVPVVPPAKYPFVKPSETPSKLLLA